MSGFIGTGFLLRGPVARRLYHEHAAPCPVVDFHCHLSPAVFADNRPFTEISDLWIAADPYKWRALRMAGVPEARITGNIGADERFALWAAALPGLAGNPLYVWSHLELLRFFDVAEPLTPANAAAVRAHCNARLAEPAFRPRELLRRGGFELFCTSDDWLDDLRHHHAVAGENPAPPVRMLPSLRADAALDTASPGFAAWLRALADAAGLAAITGLGDFLAALERRLNAFAAAGCRLADHGIDHLRFAAASDAEADTHFARLLAGQTLDADAHARLQTWLLLRLAAAYARRGWTLQLHLGARRATSTRLARASGKAGGYATIGEPLDIGALSSLLDAMEQAGGLPRSILFPLNPSDFERVANLGGSFVVDGSPGHVQLGPAWWYNDHRDGIARQLRATAAHGHLGSFIGMTTDSRSYLSATRHELYRRVLCDLLGEWVGAGELPDDDALLAPLVRDLCHGNAAALFPSPF